MSMDIATGFAGRSVFMTGGTGFVGKVLLYKILSEIPDIKNVYLLCRGKKPRRSNKVLNPQERLEKEVLGSQCFEPLRQRLGKEKWASLSSRVKAVNGDITLDGLGLSNADRDLITNNVELIVHLAATVNFNERLNASVQMNTLGGLRVLMLAKKCKKLEAMVHVSTCYVNFQRQGRDNPNMEKIYPLEFDPEAMVKHILAMHDEEVPQESKRLLREHNFPNTYTFTKSMGEQLLCKYKENVPLVIVRPSIIGASLRDPFPGWVDALTAAGGLLLTGCLGVLRELNLRSDLLADVVPVDFVVNVIIKALYKTQQYYKNPKRAITPSASSVSSKAKSAVTSATKTVVETATKTAVKTTVNVALGKEENKRGKEEEKENNAGENDEVKSAVKDDDEGGHPFIYQAATTSCLNAMTWERFYLAAKVLMDSTARKHPKALSRFDVTLSPSSAVYRLRFTVLRYFPFLVLQAMSMLPEPLGSEERRKLVAKLGRAVRRADMLNTEFHDFVVHEWVYDTTNSRGLDKDLNEKSRKAFHFDPLDIDWFSYVQHYIYGLFAYIVKDTGDLKKPPPPQSSVELFRRAVL